MSAVSTPDRARTTGSLLSYRTIDLVTVATLGVACGVVFWAWAQAWNGISTAAMFTAPPVLGLLAGP